MNLAEKIDTLRHALDGIGDCATWDYYGGKVDAAARTVKLLAADLYRTVHRRTLKVRKGGKPRRRSSRSRGAR